MLHSRLSYLKARLEKVQAILIGDMTLVGIFYSELALVADKLLTLAQKEESKVTRKFLDAIETFLAEAENYSLFSETDKTVLLDITQYFLEESEKEAKEKE